MSVRYSRGYLRKVATVERTVACALGYHAVCERVGCPCMHHVVADRNGAAKAMARIVGRDGYAATEGRATAGR